MKQTLKNTVSVTYGFQTFLSLDRKVLMHRSTGYLIHKLKINKLDYLKINLNLLIENSMLLGGTDDSQQN